MKYIITNGKEYLVSDHKAKGITLNKEEATVFTNMIKANNAYANIRHPDKKYGMQVIRADQLCIKPLELEYDIDSRIADIQKSICCLEKRKHYLFEKLKVVDAEIVDIEHAAEFYILNAAQGYKIYKMLHNARIDRRKIKDEIEKIGYMLNGRLKSDVLKNVNKSIEGMKNRKYAPRVIKELFNV